MQFASLGIAIIALGLAAWSIRLALKANRRADDAELFIADCINPDGDALIITLVRE